MATAPITRARIVTQHGETESGPLFRTVVAGLVLLLLLLQFKLWFGDGNLREVWQLRDAVERQSIENARLKQRNDALEAEVEDLKKGLAAIEERARKELGMVKKGETFYQIVEVPASTSREQE